MQFLQFLNNGDGKLQGALVVALYALEVSQTASRFSIVFYFFSVLEVGNRAARFLPIILGSTFFVHLIAGISAPIV